MIVEEYEKCRACGQELDLWADRGLVHFQIRTVGEFADFRFYVHRECYVEWSGDDSVLPKLPADWRQYAYSKTEPDDE